MGKNKDEKSEILVSIVIPSYNRYPLNLYLLESLKSQTFPHDKMEVIFVDDASTDETKKLSSQIDTPYSIKWVRNESPLGRAKARNKGVTFASGEILVFLDAEMVAAPGLIETHYFTHKDQENLVMSGWMEVRKLFTVLYPEFKRKQLKKLRSLYKDNQDVLSLNNQDISSQINLLSLEEITNLGVLDKRSYPLEDYEHILNSFGDKLKGFKFSWINFCTGNVSLSKYLFQKVGGFDEQFTGYGFEDWDLGFRLYKEGAKFIHNGNAKAYHQEHPISKSNWQDVCRNQYNFQSRYKDIKPKLLVLYLSAYPLNRDFVELNQIACEYKELRKDYPRQYKLFKKILPPILSHASLLLSKKKKLKNLAKSARINEEVLGAFSKEVEYLREEYPNLINLYEQLIKL
ncbi:glycosyltransferase family 2 protein [Anaerobacillus alkaliphilus]|nr:glycosyltransferase family 2 protein [Anaerobacillus alkaliphilus]